MLKLGLDKGIQVRQFGNRGGSEKVEVETFSDISNLNFDKFARVLRNSSAASDSKLGVEVIQDHI